MVEIFQKVRILKKVKLNCKFSITKLLLKRLAENRNEVCHGNW
ncbi:hypothetical protein HMPREF0345_1437 [Enterococcus faecalis ATCC 29200]|uniref:Uncharacterized protein n=1 Tax=Enterococcus faecalis TX0630 TaxID=749508 RepID=A0ABC9P8M2_ENTFL|nr:hypothetical protein HMPREF0345_1437 [Enterococcus faecalis ATCC 29200]EEN75837.1 hypothetical protein HMPREF0349_0175 [Enterococcus faecalis TX1322]EFM68033.1 hypothetical protein HMPREF9509_00641 [Enterococcus faecalis TX0411]EFT37504.1 hypothetical protein HMPREF9494_02775 [Enterococcus faecalis TX2137]EFT42227.1 hypothetical protein HMPREF9496_00677 [Enterococcus faecalis TX4000]EFT87837.1 hypothetical protein HMPREF9495_02423 [Enterococcus faecalis TX2141]EFT93982.1 hypothetical prote